MAMINAYFSVLMVDMLSNNMPIMNNFFFIFCNKSFPFSFK